MKRFIPVPLLLILFAVVSVGQQDIIKVPASGIVLSDVSDGGDEFENVLLRNQYWFQRNAFPFDRIPEGAYRRAVRQKQSMPMFSPDGMSKKSASMRWTNVGPVNIGGRIVATTINPKNPNTMYIGAADGGVWKTIDGGRSWFSVSDLFPTQAMGALAINPIDTNVVYAGTGEAGWGGRMFEGMGMLKSTNGGATWEALTDTNIAPYVRVSQFAINPLDPDILYAAIPEGTLGSGEGGIYKSTNGGDTWTRVFLGICTDVIIDPLHPDVLYTASSKVVSSNNASNPGIHKTTDGGVTWNKMNVPTGVLDDQMGRTSLGLSAGHPEVVYAGISEVTGGGKTRLLGIFRTLNAGDSWEQVEVPFDYMVSQGWYDNCIAVDPVNPDIVFAGGVKLIRTSDGGKSWHRIPDQVQGGVLHVDQHEILFDPKNPDNVYIGNDGGYFRVSQNGQLTEKLDYGLAITQFVGGAMHPTSDAYLLGGTQDNGTMNSSTAPDWDRIQFGDGGFSHINPLNPLIQFTTDWGLSLARSEDFGRSWERALTGFPPREGTLFYSPYAMDPVDPDILYFGTSRIFKTTNSGRLWIPVNNCMFPTGGGYCYYVSAVTVPAWDHRWVLAGATGGDVGMSTDAGQSWRITTPGPQRWCNSVRSFEPGIIFAVFGGYLTDHVYRSTDSGNSWVSLQNNLPDIPVNDIFASGTTYVVGTDIGTFISSDAGMTWEILADGMHAVSVQQLLYNPNTGTLRAITHGRGMYDMQFTPVPPTPPVFVSRPDTTLLQPGQQFIYAAVAKASPPASFTLVTGPTGMTLDPDIGLVRWTASDLVTTITIEATNSAGTARQVFDLHTADVIPAYDWQVISPSRTGRKTTTRLFQAGRNILWFGHDTGVVSRSTDGGMNWERFAIPNHTSRIHDLYAFDASTCFVTNEHGSFLKTTDGGATWKTVYSGINARYGSIHFFNTQKGIAVTQGEKDSADILFTNDGGETWRLNGRRPWAQRPITGTLRFMDDTYGWFASSNRGSSPPDYAELLRTTDGGITWYRAKTHCREISDYHILENGNGYIVDRQSGIIDRVRGWGAAFTQQFLPFSGEANHTVQLFEGTDVIWIVNNTHAWLSRDGGVVWTPTTFVPAGIISSAVFADTSLGWAVSYHGIVQQHSLNPMVSVKREAGARPERTALHQNYPNPFGGAANLSSATTIRFTIPERAHVRLRIFTPIGTLLEEPVNREIESGNHFITWDAAGLAAGTYFYQLTTGGKTITRSMVLLK